MQFVIVVMVAPTVPVSVLIVMKNVLIVLMMTFVVVVISALTV